MACVKHYACNSMENARFSVDVQVDERALHEVYLPHFRAVVDAGVASVMSAYNSVNGEWCGQNRTLLTEILRDEWGFDGFVMSDFIWGLRDPVGSVAAGLDIEMPFAQQRAQALPAGARLGRGVVGRRRPGRARGSWRTQLRFAASGPPEPPPREVVASTEHRALAREVAGAVDGAAAQRAGRRPSGAAAGAGRRCARLAVVGRLADLPEHRRPRLLRRPGPRWSHRSPACGRRCRREVTHS